MGAWTSGDVSSGELSWGELSRMGNRPGGELSCWGILLGIICVGVVQWGDILEHSKLLAGLLY